MLLGKMYVKLPKFSEEEKEDSEEESIGPKLAEQAEPELLVRDDSWRKDAPIRDWDRGKEPQARGSMVLLSMPPVCKAVPACQTWWL